MGQTRMKYFHRTQSMMRRLVDTRCKPDCLNERNGHERGRQSGRHAESLSLIFAVSPNRGAESRSPGWMMEAGAFVKSAIRSG